MQDSRTKVLEFLDNTNNMIHMPTTADYHTNSILVTDYDLAAKSSSNYNIKSSCSSSSISNISSNSMNNISMDPGASKSSKDEKSTKKLKKKKLRKKEKSKQKPTLSESENIDNQSQTKTAGSEQFVSRIFVPFSSNVFQDGGVQSGAIPAIEKTSFNRDLYNVESQENITKSNNNLTIRIQPQMTHHTLPRTNPVVARTRSDAAGGLTAVKDDPTAAADIGGVKRSKSLTAAEPSAVKQVGTFLKILLRKVLS